MRLGVLTTSFPRSPGDPAGSFVLRTAEILAGRGHRVEVLAPEPAGPAVPGTEALGPRLLVRRLPYLRPRRLERAFYGAGAPDNLRREPLVAGVGAAAFTASLAAGAARSVALGRWDRVVAHWLVPAGLVAARLPVPTVVVAHSSDVALLERMPGGGRVADAIAGGSERLGFTHPDLARRFLALLGGGRRTARAAGKSRVVPMPHGVARPPGAGDRSAARAALGVGDEAFVALSVARLVPVKGVDVVIDALAQLGEIDAVLLVAGDGPERPGLERRARARELGGRVRWLGQLGQKALEQARAAADVAVAPSRPLPDGRDEGAPVAVGEALAAGLPILASRTGGLPSLVQDGDNGWLVPPGDAGALAEALRDACHRPDERARRAARALETGHALSEAVAGAAFADWVTEGPAVSD
ncbi:MAG TPA: glycosyltransferase [Polyangiaceae bacterium LLY-WYZ-14_1]|nr:glycosyltransferase [Polyangiaceae bacterium LLY-WYZ-14_1]